MSKNGEPIRDATTHLLCYKVRLASGSPPFRGPGRVFVNDQFGQDEYAIFAPRELCVPSLHNP